MALNLSQLISSLPPVVTGTGEGAGVNQPLNEIVVPGSVETSLPPRMNNVDYLEEAMYAQQDAPQRSGMFGVKGTLRDILGTVGDAFLTQSGNQRIYAPQRERERMGDAMAGMTDNPLAAVERLAAMGANREAQALLEQVQTQGARQATIDNQIANREADAATQADKLYQQYLPLFSQFAATLDAENYEQMRPLLQRLKERGGLGDEFYLPETFDPDLMAAYGSGTMTAAQRATDTRGQRQLEISQQNADSQRINATRPRQQSQPRAETDSERYVRIMDKPASQRTTGENEWAARYRNGTSNRGSTGRTVPARSSQPASPASRFRPVQ